MAEKTTLARPYAKAVFDFAVQQNQISMWQNFLANLSTLVSSESFKYLENPSLTETKRFDILVGILGAENDFQKNFIKLLLSYKRLYLADEIALLFEQLCKEMQQQIKVQVISAFPISETLEKKLVQALKIRLQKEIILSVDVEPSIIGGAIIKAGDFVIDGSILGQLEKLKMVLEH